MDSLTEIDESRQIEELSQSRTVLVDDVERVDRFCILAIGRPEKDDDGKRPDYSRKR